MRPRQNGRRFADDTFTGIFSNENVRISINISLKFVPKGPINNNPALVQIMAWRRSGDKPLSEPMMFSLLTHICVTRPQWVNGKMKISCAEWWLLCSDYTTDLIPQESLGLYSLSGKTSYRKISWSLEAARFGFKLFQSLWNLAGTSAALLPRCLSNFRAIRPLQHPISQLRDFTRFGGKTSYRLVNRGPAHLSSMYAYMCVFAQLHWISRAPPVTIIVEKQPNLNFISMRHQF